MAIFDESDEEIVDKDLRNQFYLSITEWTEDYIELFINFTYPLEVSNGDYKDRMEIEVLNSSYFISAESMKPLD